MALAVVQTKGAQVSAVSCAVTLDVAPTSGNLLVGAFRENNLTADVVLPGGWTQILAQAESGSSRDLRLAYRIAGGAEPATVTWQNSLATSTEKQMEVWEISGADATPLDKTASRGDSVNGQSFSPGPTGVLGFQDEIAIAVCAPSGDIAVDSESVDSDFTLRDAATHLRLMAADKIVSGSGILLDPTFTWVTTRGRTAAIATFKASGAAAAVVQGTPKSLMGVGL